MSAVSPLVTSRSGFSVELDRVLQKGLADSFADYAKFTSQALIDLVKEEAALTCREAMVYSPPLDEGGGQGDKRAAEVQGDAAVSLDVRSVVIADNKSLAASVSPATGNGNKFAKWKAGKRPKQGIFQKIYDDQDFARAYSKARNLFLYRAFNLVGPDGIKEEHDRERRLFRGRIRRNNGPSTKRSPGSQKIAQESAIKAYIKTRQKRVGFMKAGWFAAINKLGAPKINGVRKNFGVKGLPSWIKRHASNYGQVTIVGAELAAAGNLSPGDKRLNVIVRNDIGNIFSAAARADTARKVLLVRSGKMAARIGHFQKIAAERFNSGQQQP
jgi:hypothetical protein